VASGERSDVLERAMGYPYAAPSHAFVQLGHSTLDPAEVDVDWRERVPLLAYGSNAAPAALAHKLALSNDPVLVVPAWIRDFDIVYSAHISPYGAVPATLQRSPGTTARVHVARMTREQIVLVSATEPNYEPTLLEGVECVLDGGEAAPRLSAYVSRHGCLLIDGAEVALSAVQATERQFAELSEPEVLEYVRAATCPSEDMEGFVLGNVTDPALAEARTAALPRTDPVLDGGEAA
jgi:hypothetical protein